MTRAEHIKELQAKLERLAEERKELEALRGIRGTDFEDFLKLSNRISAISVDQYTCKVKIRNLRENRPQLGESIPVMTEVTNINSTVSGGFKKS